MAERRFSRLLGAAVMTIVFILLLTLPVLADNVAGGKGIITGLDPSLPYKAKSVTVNSAGNGATFGDAFDLNPETNKNLAGLYVVSFDGFQTQSEIIYVEGAYSQRADLGTYDSAASKLKTALRTNAADSFQAGVYLGTRYGYSAATRFCNNYTFNESNTKSIFGAEIVPTQKALADAIASNNTAEVTKIKTAVKTILENYFISYAYTPDDVIPVSELLSMKFARAKLSAYDGFKISSVTAKVVFYVMDENGNVTQHVWTDGGKTLNYYDSTLVENTVDAQSVLPDKGWVVGFKYYPAGEVSLDNITYYSTTSTSARVYEFTMQIGSAYDGYYVIKVPKAETPTGITYDADTNTLSGLVAGTDYSLVPYTVLGVSKTGEVKVSAAGSTYTLSSPLGAGLWGIRVAASTSYSESDPIVFYVEGAYKDRADLGTYTSGVINSARDRTGVDDYWKLGYFYGAAYTSTYQFYNNYGFNATKTVDIFGAELVPTQKALADAEASGDTETVKKIKTAVKTAFENFFVSYAYTSDEIIPASELLTMKVARAKLSAFDGFKVTPVTPKVVFAVMDETGKVSEYTWTGTSKALGYYDSNFVEETVDAQSVLPDRGWVVGFRYYPVGEVSLDAITHYSATSTSDRLYEFMLKVGSIYEGYYEISVPKADKPTGITYDDETKTLSGLKPDTSYAMAQYTVMGRNNDSEILFTSIGESYAIPSDIGTGVWGLSFAADDKFATSDPALFYVKGKSDDRKALGTYEEGVTTPLATRDRQSPEDTWKLGYFYGAGIVGGKLSNNYAFKADNVISIFGADMSPTPKALFDAVNADDTEEAENIRKNVKTILENYFVSYAYTSDEIIPADELFTLKIGLVKMSAFDGFMVTNSKPRLDVFVMDPDGNITPYSYIGATRAVNYYSNSWVYDTINVQDDIDLPEDGWIVGFKYYPMQDIDPSQITTYSNNPTSSARVYELYFAMGSQYSDFYTIKEDGATPEISTFPVIPGGYGEIGGLSAQYQYEIQTYDIETGEWSRWEDVPAGSTAIRVTKSGDYRVRVKDTPRHGKSDIVEVTVYDYDAEHESFNSEIVKIHLPSDYTELEADYTMDVSVKNWVSYLTLENIKYLSPESTITFDGGDYKIVVTAKNVQIPADGKSHYYNMAVSFDGESRHDTLYDMFREKTGERYLTEVYFESSKTLPFKSAQLMIYVGEEYSGSDLELRSYFEIIDRLRKVETATVFEGWVTFNNFSETYVVLLPK